MNDKILLKTFIFLKFSAIKIFFALRESYQKWQGQGTPHVVNKTLKHYENHPALPEALMLFKEYLTKDETPGEHPFRKEKKQLFLDAYTVKITDEFNGLLKLIDFYIDQLPKKIPEKRIATKNSGSALNTTQKLGLFFTTIVATSQAVDVSQHSKPQHELKSSQDQNHRDMAILQPEDNVYPTYQQPAMQSANFFKSTGLVKKAPSGSIPFQKSDKEQLKILRTRIINLIEPTEKVKLKNPDLDKLKSRISKMFADLWNTNHELRCRLETILKQPDFHIKVMQPEEMGKRQAYFNKRTNSINLRSTIKETDQDNINTVVHESDHAFVAEGNFAKNHNDFFITRESPTETLKQSNDKVQNIIKTGIKTIDHYIDIMKKPADKLSPSEESELARLKTYAKSYKRELESSLISDRMIQTASKHGYIDQDLNVISAFPVITDFPDIHAYIYKLEKGANGKIYGYSRWSADANDNTMDALMDCLDTLRKLDETISSGYDERFLSTQDEDVKLGLKLLEQDGHIHGIYQRYIELFDLLFHDLRQFHYNRSGDDYRQCMDDYENLGFKP